TRALHDALPICPGYEWLADQLTAADKNDKVRRLMDVAQRIDTSVARLSIAWCLRNPNVSTVITGSSSIEQLQENLAALEVVERLSPEILDEIDQIMT